MLDLRPDGKMITKELQMIKDFIKQIIDRDTG